MKKGRKLIGKKIICVLIAMIFILMMCSMSAFAKEVLTVRVGVFPLGNFCYFDEKGEPSGYYPDFVSKLNEYAHWKIEYVKSDNWKESLEMLNSGGIDVLAPAQMTPEREDIYLFSSFSMSTELGAVYALTERDDLIFDDFDTLKNLKYGCVDDSPITDDFLGAYAKFAGFTPNVSLYYDASALFEALYNKEVDAVASNIMLGNDTVKMIGRYGPAAVYFITKKDERSNMIMAEMDDALTEMRLDLPTFENTLFNTYFNGFSNDQFTKEEIDFIKELPQVSVGYVTENKPLSYTNEDGEFDGITKDILDKISELSGIHFSYVALPSTNISEEYLYERRIYVVSNVEYNSVNLSMKYMSISTPYFDTDKVLVARQGLDYDSQSALKVALCSGSKNLERVILQSYPNFTFEIFDTVEKCFDAVKCGKADASLQNRYVTETTLTNIEYTNLSVLPIKSISDELCLATLDFQDGSKLCGMLNSGIFISIIDKCIRQISTEEINDSIILNTAKAKYHPTVWDVMRQNIWMCILSLVLICLIMVFLIYRQRVERIRANELNQKNNELDYKNRELESAVQEANRANRSKSEFLARMSHDMRTPMNGILGLVALSKDETEVTELKDYLTKIDESGKYLLGIINDTLDLQRIESGKLTLEYEVVNCRKTIETAIEMVRPAIEAKNIDFRIVNNGIIMDSKIRIDTVRIKQIFVNLISNAIKFTPEGGKIAFKFECLGRKGNMTHTRFSIHDTGVGMSESFIRNKIFRPYSQEQNSFSNQYAGTGLGLSIVKKLVEMMNGTIAVKSEVGVGTAFIIEMDIERVYDTEEQNTASNETKRQEDEFECLNGCNILLAEDHPLNAEIAKKLLEKVGCNVTWVKNGVECLDTMKSSTKGHFDVILMDLRMPIMDGLTATAEIRNLDSEYAKSIPIIAITANAYSDDIEHCLNAGMNAHIAKPIQPLIMYRQIAEVLKK